MLSFLVDLCVPTFIEPTLEINYTFANENYWIMLNVFESVETILYCAEINRETRFPKTYRTFGDNSVFARWLTSWDPFCGAKLLLLMKIKLIVFQDFCTTLLAKRDSNAWIQLITKATMTTAGGRSYLLRMRFCVHIK